MHIDFHAVITAVRNPWWWFELWVHITFICSAASYVLSPYEEWAQENKSPEEFKKIHARINLIQRYGALSKRSKLKEFAAALEGVENSDSETGQKSASVSAGQR
jgi:hypothetical protein